MFFASIAQGAEYLRDQAPADPDAHPVTGALDHGLDKAPEPPTRFLGPLFEHLNANFRSYDYRRKNEGGDWNAASVIGGSFGYRSGLWRDRLGFGASLYTSQKIWGPDSKAGSGLLQPTQESFTVLGELYGELKIDSLQIKAYRHTMDLPYINRDDSREVPVTHESYMLGRRGTGRDFVVGHVTRIKSQDDDSFVSMSEAAGVTSKDRGVSLAGFNLKLSDELRFGAMTQYGWDTFNTVYSELMWDHRLASGWSNHLGAQFTDQSSVGDELLGDYSAHAWGVRGGVGYEGQLLIVAYTDYSDNSSIARPYGGTPSFNGLMLEKADKPGEQSIGVHLASHFSKFGLPNWSANMGIVNGWNIVDADTGASQPDETEFDFTLDFKPKQGRYKGLWVRMRSAYVDFDSGAGHSWNTRVIINYTVPGLGGS